MNCGIFRFGRLDHIRTQIIETTNAFPIEDYLRPSLDPMLWEPNPSSNWKVKHHPE